MTHLGYEDRHAWTLIAVVETKLHLIALGVERRNVFVDFVAGNEKSLQLPLYAHEEHAVELVYILVKVYDVAFVVGYKFRYFCDDALLVGAVQKQNGRLFHLSSLVSIFLFLTCKGTKKK
jgi:hypothetical protein